MPTNLETAKIWGERSSVVRIVPPAIEARYLGERQFCRVNGNAIVMSMSCDSRLGFGREASALFFYFA